MASIHPTATIASTAVLRGEVQVSAGAVIRDGVILVADGSTIRIGENPIVMEHAVIRSTTADDCTLGAHVMVGPDTHLTGCTLEDEVFIATGASAFNGATLKKWAEGRIKGVVPIDLMLEEGASVPIGWVAVGSPAQIFSPERHDDIWAIQKNLNFPTRVFGEPRSSEDGVSLMRRMIGKYAAALRKRLGRYNT